MPQTLMIMISHLIEAAKENHTGAVACCWCNNVENIIKHGTYERYAFLTQELIKIQRHLCKSDRCGRTFSILPHPFLRITRWSLCMYQEILNLIESQISRSEVRRRLELSWPTTIARAVERARDILSWVDQEAKTEPIWAPSPCMHPSQCWSDFIAMFAAHFYPKRYGSIRQQNMNISHNQ